MKYQQLWTPEVEARLQAEGKNLDEQKPPSEVVMCKRCCMTSARPRIEFDEHGICSACRYSDEQANGIDWDQRAQELEELLQKHRKSSGFDCIVPCSGGKDSATVAWKLKNEWGMNPLCATWAPFIYTDIGWKNFQNFVQSGFDCVTAFPNGIIHRKLARLSLEFYGDHFIPFIFGQLCWPMHVARQNGVKLVFYAENGEATYGGDSSANHKPCWDFGEWDRIYQKGANIDKLLLLGREIGALTEDEINYLNPFYRLPDGIRDGVQFHWLGYYQLHHPQSNYYLAAEHTGFEANDARSIGTFSRYASLDDATDDWHYFLGFLKFGIGRTTSDAAHEIRDGDLDRDEALSLVQKYDGEFPGRSYNQFMQFLGLSEDHFERILDRFNLSNRDWRKKRLESHCQ